jgi:hypothetical protein
VRYVVGIAFLIVGNLAFFAGGRMVLTGRNMPGLLGRGLTSSDDLKLRRAPTVYFRAMGSVLSSLGLLIVWLGLVFLTTPQQPTDAFLVSIFSLAGLIVAALVASAIWLSVIAAHYKLFRWNKP